MSYREDNDSLREIRSKVNLRDVGPGDLISIGDSADTSQYRRVNSIKYYTNEDGEP